MIQSAVLGGVFIGVLSALPIINVANCCCLWIAGGGLLAAYLEHQHEPQSLTVGRGAYVGLLAGIIGAMVWLFASLALDSIVTPLQQRMVEEMLRGASDMPPDARDWLQTLGERAASPVRYVLGFMFHLFAGVVFASAGGAIGATFFGRGRLPVEPPPLPPS